jgi:hypothetical protein
MLYDDSTPMKTERVLLNGVPHDKITIDRVTTIYKRVDAEPPRRGRPPKVTHDDAGAES